jgi:glycerophosphoryl diester phosphodiesterase
MEDRARPTATSRAPGALALVVAHRGAWDPAPQNSLAAFSQAIAAGADGIELDVRRSADGRLVVVHDPRIGVRPVGRLDTAALRGRMSPGQAPELGEVLAAMAGRITIDIELKEDGYVGETMEVIARHLHPGQYVVTSFLDVVLPQVREAVPAARTGLLLGSRRRGQRLERRVVQASADFIAPHATMARAGLLAWAAHRGLPAWVWTVNEPRALRMLLADPRVEAIITDRAGEAVRVARGLARAGLATAA